MGNAGSDLAQLFGGRTDCSALVLGQPRSGRSTLIRALCATGGMDGPADVLTTERHQIRFQRWQGQQVHIDEEFDLLVLVLDASASGEWATETFQLLTTLHHLNAGLRIAPLLVVVNKQDRLGAVDPAAVVRQVQASGTDVCTALGGRAWIVLGASAATGAGVNEVRVAMEDLIAKSKDGTHARVPPQLLAASPACRAPPGLRESAPP